MNKFLEVALDAAREAGAVLLVEHSRPQKISYKGEVDLVTETDKRSEAIVVGRLRREFPGHRIVAEEGSGGAAGASRYEWHVDPLDGTTNFAHGYPCFAVSIALLEDGQPLVGAVFNPVSDELFSAARGAGAFLNEKPIRVSKMEKLATSLVSTGFPDAQSGCKFEHPLLLATYFAFAWRAARWLGGLGFVFGGVRQVRCVLGIWLALLGHGGGDLNDYRGRWQGDRFARRCVSSWRAGSVGQQRAYSRRDASDDGGSCGEREKI